MKTSETITKIAPALLLAQQEIGGVAKDNTANIPTKSGGQYSYKYADLSAVIDACKKALNDNGILVMQPVNGEFVETRLIHQSGEWVSDDGVKIINARQDDPQAQGSAITYARRYGLQSLMLIPAEDDDAEKATNHSPFHSPRVSDTHATNSSTGIKCPKCGGEAYDNSLTKTNPKAPDYKCKDPNCKDAKGYVTGWWKPKNEDVPHDAEGNELPVRQYDTVDADGKNISTNYVNDDAEDIDSLINSMPF